MDKTIFNPISSLQSSPYGTPLKLLALQPSLHTPARSPLPPAPNHTPDWGLDHLLSSFDGATPATPALDPAQVPSTTFLDGTALNYDPEDSTSPKGTAKDSGTEATPAIDSQDQEPSSSILDGPSIMRVMQITTSVGKMKLKIGDELFYMNKKNKNGTLLFRCHQKRKGCSASLTLTENMARIIRMNLFHKKH